MMMRVDGLLFSSGLSCYNRERRSHGKWTRTAPSRYCRNSPLPARGFDNYVSTGRGVLMPRKSTGKRLRFEVFKRDGFTCRYCGVTSADAVLVVDHIIPVAEGGDTTIDNLNTACETCNQGKADRPLGLVQPRPDADLLYLETQQEIAELHRYRQSLQAREEALHLVALDLQDIWVAQSGLDWHPAVHVLRQMLNKYSAETVEEAVRDVAPKVANEYVKKTRWVQYMWAVLRNLESGE